MRLIHSIKVDDANFLELLLHAVHAMPFTKLGDRVIMAYAHFRYDMT
jgi:hypothetical protein